MEAIFALRTCLVGHRARDGVHDRVAHRALLDALKLLVNVILPRQDRLAEARIGADQQPTQVELPANHACLGHVELFRKLDVGGFERIRAWQRQDEAKAYLVACVPRSDFSLRVAGTDITDSTAHTERRGIVGGGRIAAL